MLADFSMQTYCRESAPLVPREWSYEAENSQLYRHRQVLARMPFFSLEGLWGAQGFPINILSPPPKMPPKHHFGYEAENLQLCRYRQVLVRVSKL